MAFLRVLNGTRRFERHRLEESSVTIGRGDECEIVLDDAWVSREHARIEAGADDGWVFVDLGSENGSFLNGRRATTGPLSDGDLLRIGGVELRFHLAATSISDDDETHLRRRLEERVAQLEAENRRLRKLAFENGARRAAPRGAGSPRRRETSGIMIAPISENTPVTFWALGPRGARLARSLRDFGVEGLAAIRLPARAEDPEGGERLLTWLDEREEARPWLLTSSRALELWIPEPGTPIPSERRKRRGPACVLIRDEGARESLVPWSHWLLRAGFGPLILATPRMAARGDANPGDGELGLASALAALGAEGRSALESALPEEIFLVGSADSDVLGPDDLLRIAGGAGLIHSGIDSPLDCEYAVLRVARTDTDPHEAERVLQDGGVSGPRQTRFLVDEGYGRRLAAVFRHPAGPPREPQ